MAMPRQKPGLSKQDYGTPPEFLTAVKNRLKIPKFDIDLAATYDNAVADECYTERMNALSPEHPWKMGDGWSWLNPPYARLAPWVLKAASEAANGAQIAMLVPASVGSGWWAYAAARSYQAFLQGRLTFNGETAPYPKDCALLLWTPWGFTGQEIWRWSVK